MEWLAYTNCWHTNAYAYKITLIWYRMKSNAWLWQWNVIFKPEWIPEITLNANAFNFDKGTRKGGGGEDDNLERMGKDRQRYKFTIIISDICAVENTADGRT
jgi:hypothetical protein